MKAEKPESKSSGFVKVPGLGFLTRIESGREVCLAHASDLLRAARAIQEQDLPHIAYHLATLALEEIGKTELIGLEEIGRTREETPSWAAKHALDHTKKIFGACFGALFGQEVMDRRFFDDLRLMATSIHETRVRGLYVDLSTSTFRLSRDGPNVCSWPRLCENSVIANLRRSKSHQRSRGVVVSISFPTCLPIWAQFYYG